MTKYEKFIFQELPKNLVVNFHDNHEIDYNKDELINHVITQHLQTIVTEENDSADEIDDIATEVDLDQIRLESYNKGLDDAKINYEKIISELQSENNLSELLQEKILEIAPKLNLDNQVAKLTSQIITNIAKKIYLILPVDFEQTLRLGLLDKLKKIYKEGQIKLSVNPERYDFCNNILQTENLPVKLKENIHIIKDDDINIDDCRLEWSNTILEYNHEQISVEIEKILEQIKSLA
jgi:flagellar biosynthesis/type III secretory pathway protein FliH